MQSILKVEEFESRLAPHVLPLKNDVLDFDRINLALAEATGLIVAHLPWLIDEKTKEIILPLQFEEAIKAVCVDLALNRLTDAVTSSEDSRAKFNASIKILETISREYKGGLHGPDYQSAEIVEAGGDPKIEDPRFFKKGFLNG